jgi:hypothetical protein
MKSEASGRCGGKKQRNDGDAALREAVVAAVRTTRTERRLSCAKALELAEQFGVRPARVGALCDAEGIKIRQCRLGCF